MFKNCVFCRTHLTVPYNFGNFYVMIEFSGRLWVPNWHFQISYAIALISFMVHGYSVLAIKPKLLVNVSVSFACIIISALALFLIELLKFRISFQIPVSSPNTYINMWIWVFWILCCYCFSLEALLQGMF